MIRVREVKPDLRERLKAMCISSRVCQKAAKVKFDLKAEEDDSLLDFLVTVGPNLEREQPSHRQASTDVEPADHVARLWHGTSDLAIRGDVTDERVLVRIRAGHRSCDY